MKTNVLIIESNQEHVKKIEAMALSITDNLCVYTANTLAEAYKLLLETTMDVFIVNVVLHTIDPADTSGMRLIERVREIPKYVLTPVIFISNQRDVSLYAYKELNCLAYLPKPCRVEDFTKALKKAVLNKTNRSKDRVMFFRKQGVIYSIHANEIVYMECYEHIVYIHLSDGSVEEFPYQTYARMLAEADVDFLMQCNRAAVVNKNFIHRVDFPNRRIFLKNNMGTLDIGTTYKKRVKDEFVKKYPTSRAKDGVLYSDF